jgi:UDP-N-acetylmuramyl tripeptide synthase
MDLIATWIGKVVQTLLRLLGRKGGTFPGKIVETMRPSYLGEELSRLPMGVVVVSGTNGKTTTTKMLASVMGSRYRVLTNPTGSNFTRGVVAAVVDNNSWSGHLDYDLAVLELDEAYAVRFAEQHAPRAVLILNVMRDQMDRFGEIDHTARLLGAVTATATDVVVLNRDDPRVAALTRTTDQTDAEITWFGVGPDLRETFRTDDELHLAEVAAAEPLHPADVELQALDGQVATFAVGGSLVGSPKPRRYDVPLQANGIHNAQNAAAVLATALALGLDADQAIEEIAKVQPAFGRGEEVHVGGRRVVLQLAKNPGGFRLALMSGVSLGADVSMVAINDDYADGRDVSWLWDVDFSVLSGTVMAAGVRAADMALRLTYDEVATASVQPGLVAALDEAIARTPEGGLIVIYTTYTAMWQLHQELERRTRGVGVGG